ncbi:hypothetical protein BC833DRAFT_626591 [Globomyces pollinis-pini]|nr:hypothetical protein BC833DRAFT_626591 [Globomyces pollinis-pini]
MYQYYGGEGRKFMYQYYGGEGRKFMYQYYVGEGQFYRAFPMNSDEIKWIPLFPELSIRNERNGPTTYQIIPGKHDDSGNAFLDVFVKIMLLNLPKIMQNAGIDNPNDSTRTTHPFRRGRCQYRFIYSPQPWPFDMCRARAVGKVIVLKQ